MSGTEDGTPDDTDLMAAEYVIGALQPEQARALEALALTDPGIRRSIDGWQDRLAPLAACVPPVAPPAVLWQRLALAAGIEPAAMVIRPRFWRRPGPWRATTAAALAVAACLGFLLLTRPPAAPLMAALSPSGSPGATFLVRVDEDGRATVVALGTPTAPAGRAFELWAVNAGAPPISLGVLPPEGRRLVTVPGHAGTQLLVSQEPEGGSPTGQPNGAGGVWGDADRDLACSGQSAGAAIMLRAGQTRLWCAMAAYNLTLASTVILLFPMLYFLIASPSFLFIKLEDPVVTMLLRGQFNVYFGWMMLACAVAAIVFAMSGRPIVGAALGSIAALAIGARRWFLRRIDAQIRARDAGDTDAVHRLRRLHWGGMLYNAVQAATVVASIPFVLVPAV